MNKKSILTNISYSMASNLISVIISTLITLFVPRFLGVESYGYFQLFIFYSSYTGFFHLGWADGLYLRYGGDYYDKLNKEKFSAQFYGILIYSFLIAAVLIVLDESIVSDVQKQFIWVCIGIYIVIMLPKTLLTYLLQSTNRIKEYSKVVIIERISYLVLVILDLLVKADDYHLIVIADLIGRFCSLALSFIYCKDILLTKPEPIKDFFIETGKNISVGIKLMLSNITGMLILGIIRYSTEHHWSVEVFGKVSLSLSISNLLMVFISSIALVMFPMLRRVDKDRYSFIYSSIRVPLMATMFTLMVSYYPIVIILSYWLPQYTDSLKYMAVLFPVCIYESLNGLLITTYLKSLRKEKWMLYINSCVMVLSLIVTWITVYKMDNLDYAVLSIVFLFAVRAIISELLVTRQIGVNVTREIIVELIMVSAFIALNWIIGGLKGDLLYIAVCIAYLILRREKLMKTWELLVRK